MSRDPKGYNPDHHRPIPIGKYSDPSLTVRKNSWLKAFWLFTNDNKKSIVLILARRLAVILLGADGVATSWNVLNDILLPLIGTTDDPLLLGEMPVGMALAVLIYRKVKQYRYTYTNS